MTEEQELVILAMIALIDDLPTGSESLEGYLDQFLDNGEIDEILSQIKSKLQDKE